MPTPQAPSSGDAFWNVALECSLRRAHGKCKCNFDDPACNNCRVYLRKYTQASEAGIQMLLLHTDTAANGDRRSNRKHHIFFAVLEAIFILIAISAWRFDHRPKPMDIPQSVVASVDVDKEIRDTLVLVKRDLINRVDMNHDGLINCIDSACLFYKYFPDKSRVCIELNYNPPMNHLFCCVLVNGAWRAVEPQTYWLGRQEYWMSSVWSNYDSRYNTDRTSEYLQYIK